tara:strand:- start:290 stop:502 length:213 start_codon:yes stop_codon:yes gene_type:complete
MKKSYYYSIGLFFLITGLILAVIGLKEDIDNINDNTSDGYIAMLVIGFVLIFFSVILLIIGYKKTEEEKT